MSWKILNQTRLTAVVERGESKTVRSDSLHRSAIRTVARWIVLALSLAVVGYVVGSRTMVPGPSSREALERNPGEIVALQHGIPPREVVTILISKKDGRPFARNEATLLSDRLAEQLLAATIPGEESRFFKRILAQGRTLLSDDEALFISKDRTTALIRAESNVPVYEAGAQADRWLGELERFRAEHPEVAVHSLSYGGGDREIFDLIHRDLDNSLVYTLPLTAIVLWWVFGSIGAALLPLVLAIVGLAGSLGLSALVSHLFGPISVSAHQLVVLLVLAIGVDYALFLISRVRDEYALGAPYGQAIETAQRTTGRAILWSGVTVVLSLVGLFLMHDAVLKSMAVVSILAVAVVVLLTLKTLPAVLTLLSPEVVLRRSHLEEKTNRNYNPRFAVRYPRIAIVASLLPLVFLAVYGTKVRYGSVMERQVLPRTMQTAEAFSVLERAFPEFAGTPLTVIVRGSQLEAIEDEGELQPLITRILELGGITGPLWTERSGDGQVIRYTFQVEGSANDQRNRRVIDTLRNVIIPAELAARGLEGWPSENLTYVVDETERYLSRTPVVIGGVLLLSFVVLMLAFRSLIVPLKAVALNLLSCGAAFGCLAIAFQSGIFPAWDFGVIEGFVPALLFAILFGLSMDYHVVLISRTREGIIQGLDTTTAINAALHSTGRSITGAAAIMATVFAVVATLELPVMRQLGVGLAAGVVIDATIIRLVLLPAMMILLGRWNWYLPGMSAKSGQRKGGDD